MRDCGKRLWLLAGFYALPDAYRHQKATFWLSVAALLILFIISVISVVKAIYHPRGDSRDDAHKHGPRCH